MNNIKKPLIAALTVSVLLAAMPAMAQQVKVQGHQLMVWDPADNKYESYVIRGVGYNPTPIGRYASDSGYFLNKVDPNPSKLPNNMFADPNILTRDFPLLKAMNANTIRIWAGDNTLETSKNQPVSKMTFENAFPLLSTAYGDNIYNWLVQNKYVNTEGYINVDLISTSILNALQKEFSDLGEYYTILDVLRKAYYGDANPNRFPNRITSTTLGQAGHYGLKLIAGFWVGPFGSCNSSTSPCTYTLNTYNGESNDPGLNTGFDLTNPYIANDILMRFEIYVNSFKDDPNILFWAIGNENNYSLDPNSTDPYSAKQINAWYALVNKMAAAAHAIEGANYHPVAVVSGEIASIGQKGVSDDNTLSSVDIWGANVYRGRSFYDLFVQYRSLSQKPLWVSEYGIDAWNSCDANSPAVCVISDPNNPSGGWEDDAAQALWDGDLWDEIAGNGDITIGGTVIEYSDEWCDPDDWICDSAPYNSYPLTKASIPLTDTGGEATYCHFHHFYFGEGPGSHWPSINSTYIPASPDHYFNEAWFGLMGISNTAPETQADTMHPREAYTTLQEKFLDLANNNVTLPSYLASPVNGTTLNSTKISFAWSLGKGVSKYQLLIGTSKGGGNVYSYSGTATSATVLMIPLTGRILYVQLGFIINGVWQTKNYTFSTITQKPGTH